MNGAIPSPPDTPSRRAAHLKKQHRNNLTFTLH